MPGLASRWNAESLRAKLLPELGAILTMLLLVAAFNPGLALFGQVLGGYDAFVYFYPLRSYVGESLGQGRLPLWNPYLFAGTPYLANPQTAVLYPGTWLFALLDVPRAYAVNFVAHLWLAGIGLYAFARISLGLGRVSGVLGSAAFAFSGFMNGQAGHINQFSVAAWLPVVALCLDLAVRTSRPLVMAGLVLGLTLQILAGHPQEVYMTVVALGVLLLWRGVPLGVWGVVRGALLLGGAAALAGGLAAIQLLPTLELSRLSIRGGGLSYEVAAFDALPWPLLLPALFPGYWAHLPTTEFFGHLGTVIFALAWLGLLAGAGRPALLGAAYVALGLLLAVGDATSLYRLLFDWAPGFSSFRVPARWLFISTFGLAILAAAGVDWLMRWLPDTRSTARPLLTRTSVPRLVSAGVLVPLGLASLVVLGQPQSKWLLLVWGLLVGATLLVTLGVVCLPTLRRPLLALVVVGALADLWLAGRNLEHRQTIPNLAFGQPREGISALLEKSRGASQFRSLSVATPEYLVRETGEYEQRYAGLSRLALDNLLVTVKWNETLWPNVPLVHRIPSADGYDGGVLPLRSFYDLSRAMLGAARARPDGVLASRLDALPDQQWLDLLGVRWALASRVKDDTRGAIYYDRGVSVTLYPGHARSMSALPGGEFTRLGLMSSLAGEAQPGAQVGVLRLSAAGASTEIPLLVGQQTAPEAWLAERAPTLDRVTAWSERAPDAPGDWIAEIGFARQPIATLEIVNTSQQVLHVRALNLIDDARQAAFTLTPDDRVVRTDFFDVKLYERLDALPRAYLVPFAQVLDDDAAGARLAEPTFDPRRETVLAPSESSAQLISASVPGPATIEVAQPEYVRIGTTAASDSVLVLSDSWYPGWRATVDGMDAPIERANLLFRAVRLRPGPHLVEFRYEPQSVRIGALVSAGTLLCAVLLAATAFWRQKRSAA